MSADRADKLTDALSAGHDNDTAAQHADGHTLPRITPRMLSRCCQAEECTDQMLTGRCEECGEYASFYLEGDE